MNKIKKIKNELAKDKYEELIFGAFLLVFLSGPVSITLKMVDKQNSALQIHTGNVIETEVEHHNEKVGFFSNKPSSYDNIKVFIDVNNNMTYEPESDVMFVSNCEVNPLYANLKKGDKVIIERNLDKNVLNKNSIKAINGEKTHNMLVNEKNLTYFKMLLENDKVKSL